MVPIVKNSGGKWVAPIAAGLAYAWLVALAATVLVSLLLSLTGLKEQSLPLYVYMIHGLSVLTGGFIAAKRAGEKGWYRGGALGLAYGLIVVLISSLGFDVKLSTDTLVFLPVCLLTGALGGILGINARR